MENNDMSDDELLKKIINERNNKKKLDKSKSHKKQNVYSKSKKDKISSAINKTPKKNYKSKRLTEPKKRGLLKRYIMQAKWRYHSYDLLEKDFDDGYITYRDIQKSKQASKRKDRILYKEVQEYEDARDDITARKAYRAFKIGLGTTLLAGTLALSSMLSKKIQEDSLSKQTAEMDDTLLDESLMEEDFIYDDNKVLKERAINKIKNSIKEKDGYEFDNLSLNELINNYDKILAYEERMSEHTFEKALLGFEDQELLESILNNSIGEEYGNSSDKQKRDYKQLAFELLSYAFPEIDINQYIRNPIVVDALKAKESSESLGYEIKTIVNNDEEETLKYLGKIMHTEHLYENSILSINKQENDLLDNIINLALGENYRKMTDEEKRDYKQFAYEFLSQDFKDLYVKNPIENANINVENENNESFNIKNENEIKEDRIFNVGTQTIEIKGDDGNIQILE